MPRVGGRYIAISSPSTISSPRDDSSSIFNHYSVSNSVSTYRCCRCRCCRRAVNDDNRSHVIATLTRQEASSHSATPYTHTFVAVRPLNFDCLDPKSRPHRIAWRSSWVSNFKILAWLFFTSSCGKTDRRRLGGRRQSNDVITGAEWRHCSNLLNDWRRQSFCSVATSPTANELVHSMKTVCDNNTNDPFVPGRILQHSA